jgi:hypothetical protein
MKYSLKYSKVPIVNSTICQKKLSTLNLSIVLSYIQFHKLSIYPKDIIIAYRAKYPELPVILVQNSKSQQMYPQQA